MQIATIVATWVSLIINIFLLGGVVRLLYLYGQYNKLLRDMLDVYDPDKVNRTMRAFKEQAELASEHEIRELEKNVAGKIEKEKLLLKFIVDYVQRYGVLKTTVSLILLGHPTEREFFLTQEPLPQPIWDEVRARMNELKASGVRELEPVDRRGLAGLVYSLFPYGLPPPPSEPKER